MDISLNVQNSNLVIRVFCQPRIHHSQRLVSLIITRKVYGEFYAIGELWGLF